MRDLHIKSNRLFPRSVVTESVYKLNTTISVQRCQTLLLIIFRDFWSHLEKSRAFFILSSTRSRLKANTLGFDPLKTLWDKTKTIRILLDPNIFSSCKRDLRIGCLWNFLIINAKETKSKENRDNLCKWEWPK